MRYHRPLAAAALVLGLAGALPQARASALHMQATSPRHAAVYAGFQSGGIYRTTDSGANWQHLDAGVIADSDVTALQVSSAGTVYAGTRGHGVHISTDGGASWAPDNYGSYNLAHANVVALAINPIYQQDLYVAADDGTVYTSYSGGQDWIAHSVPTSSSLNTLADDPRAPGVMLVGTAGDGIYRESGYSYNWEQVTGIPAGASVAGIAFDPHDAQVAYAATDQGIFQSTDGGASWQAENNGLPDATTFLAIAVDPGNGGHVVAGDVNGTLYYSTDGGSSWQQSVMSSSGASITALIFDPAHADHAFAGAADGTLYASIDGGANWDTQDTGNPAGQGILSLAAGAHLVSPFDPVAPIVNSPNTRYYSQTHHILRADFIPFYDTYGGMKIFGLPLSEEYTQGGYVIQFFERTALAQKGNTVYLYELGLSMTAGWHFPTVQAFPNTATRVYVRATHHSISGRFLTYWRKHHGALLFGSPISEPLREQNGDGTGRPYLVQYFEDARMEYHPELAGTPYEVSLGLLGKQYLQKFGSSL